MKLKIELDMSNAAFAGNEFAEARRILVEAAANLYSTDERTLRDINGNAVGKIVVEYDIPDFEGDDVPDHEADAQTLRLAGEVPDEERF